MLASRLGIEFALTPPRNEGKRVYETSNLMSDNSEGSLSVNGDRNLGMFCDLTNIDA
jgi:hypothetical protein